MHVAMEWRTGTCSNKMAKQYWPENVEIFDDFPKTPAGKVQKYILRETVQARLQNDIGDNVL